jgi:hypothetical protein
MIQRNLFRSYEQYVLGAAAGTPADWVVLRLLCASAQQVLRATLADPRLPDELTVSAHAASEALRAYAPVAGGDWAAAQALAQRVGPVVRRLLDAVAARQPSGA